MLSVAFAPSSSLWAIFIYSYAVRFPVPPSSKHCSFREVMNVCGVGLGCLMLMTGALLAYLGMDALMDMTPPQHKRTRFTDLI